MFFSLVYKWHLKVNNAFNSFFNNFVCSLFFLNEAKNFFRGTILKNKDVYRTLEKLHQVFSYNLGHIFGDENRKGLKGKKKE